MYECKNCGGALKFDIGSQDMRCEHCETHYNPYDVTKQTDAVQSDYFDTTAFTCPQCGGEVFSVDKEAASFCLFCGSPAILSSRISKELCPNYLIPFKVSKEDCKSAYARKMKYAFFAPKELKEPKYLEEFRGIYMPYWTYQVTQDSHLSIPAQKTFRSGDYVITRNYSCQMDITADYAGYAADASGSFYDYISEALAPYDARELVDFTPSYLCGFYADTADVPKDLYLSDAMDFATDTTLNEINSQSAFADVSMQLPSKTHLSSMLNTKCVRTDRTMYPVWFLTYRNKDRVAYATVNGQTGKVVTSMPIDNKRFLISSALTAVPVFILLNLFLTLIPSTLVTVISAMSLFTLLLYYSEISSILAKEYKLGDRGYQSKADSADEQEASGNDKKTKIRSKKASVNNTPFLTFAVIVVAFVLFMMTGLISKSFIWMVLLVAGGIVACMGVSRNKKIADTTNSLGFIVPFVCMLISTAIMIFAPVSDLYYYAAAIVSIAGTLYTLTDIIRNYNILATNPLPQYQKMGGDHNA